MGRGSLLLVGSVERPPWLLDPEQFRATAEMDDRQHRGCVEEQGFDVRESEDAFEELIAKTMPNDPKSCTVWMVPSPEFTLLPHVAAGHLVGIEQGVA